MPWRPLALGERGLHDVWAVTSYGPQVAFALHRYKGAGRRGWARIFARLLLARLEEIGEPARAYDLLVPCPTFVGHGGRGFDHTGLVLEWARRQAPGRWPIELDLIGRTRPVPALKLSRGWRSRLTVARTQLRVALTVSAPELVRGRAVLIYDDVMTTGATAGEVGRVLREAGATRTGAIVLARQALHSAAVPS